MKIAFQQIRNEDFKKIHDLALIGWYFAYNHLKKVDLKPLVDKYFSDKELEKALAEVKSGKRYFILVFEGDNLVGFCDVALRKNQGELLHLYINPDKIGQGLGKTLLLLGEKFLKSNKIKKYFTFVNRHNKLGYDFYVRNKFKHIPAKDMDDEFEKKILWYIEKEF